MAIRQSAQILRARFGGRQHRRRLVSRAICTGSAAASPRDDAKAFSYYGRVADAFDTDENDQNRLRIMVDAMVRVADY